jgi:DNA-binding response OmpR family regulator
MRYNVRPCNASKGVYKNSQDMRVLLVEDEEKVVRFVTLGLKAEGFAVDAARHVKRDGTMIRLTAKEYSLLEYLAVNSGRVLSRTMIVEHVWDEGFEGLTNIVDVYIRQLRAKIDQPFTHSLIHTVRREGYVLSEHNQH